MSAREILALAAFAALLAGAIALMPRPQPAHCERGSIEQLFMGCTPAPAPDLRR